MAGSWWSVTGLVLDITGFIVLAIDLNRDYSRVAQRNQYRRRVESFTEAWSRPEPANPERDDLQKAIHDHWRFSRRTSELAIRLSYYDLTGKVADPDEMLRVVRQAADAPLREVNERPPVRAGIGLIILGFVFQIVGSWP